MMNAQDHKTHLWIHRGERLGLAVTRLTGYAKSVAESVSTGIRRIYDAALVGWHRPHSVK